MREFSWEEMQRHSLQLVPLSPTQDLYRIVFPRFRLWHDASTPESSKFFPVSTDPLWLERRWFPSFTIPIQQLGTPRQKVSKLDWLDAKGHKFTVERGKKKKESHFSNPVTVGGPQVANHSLRLQPVYSCLWSKINIMWQFHSSSARPTVARHHMA